MSQPINPRGVKMLRCSGTLVLVATLLFFALSHAPETYGAEVTTLRFVTLQSPGNYQTVEVLKGLNAVTEKTKGSIKFQVHYGTESGFQQKEYLYAMKNGLIDGAITGHASVALEYPFLNITGIFFLLPSGEYREPGIKALRPTIDEFFMEQGAVPLAHFVYMDASVIYSRRNIASMSDLKGMLIRIYDPASIALVKSLGGVPVSIAKSETYTALQKKTIDGACTDTSAAKDMNFIEVCKYMLMIHPNFNAISIALSKKTWDKLSNDQQNVFRDVFTTWEKNMWAKINDPVEQSLCYEYAKKNGMTILELPADVKAKIPAIREEQIQLYLSKGGDRGKRMIETINSMIAKQGK